MNEIIMQILKDVHSLAFVVCIFMLGFYLGELKEIKNQLKEVNKKERN